MQNEYKLIRKKIPIKLNTCLHMQNKLNQFHGSLENLHKSEHNFPGNFRQKLFLKFYDEIIGKRNKNMRTCGNEIKFSLKEKKPKKLI